MYTWCTTHVRTLVHFTRTDERTNAWSFPDSCAPIRTKSGHKNAHIPTRKIHARTRAHKKSAPTGTHTDKEQKTKTITRICRPIWGCLTPDHHILEETHTRRDKATEQKKREDTLSTTNTEDKVWNGVEIRDLVVLSRPLYRIAKLRQRLRWLHQPRAIKIAFFRCISRRGSDRRTGGWLRKKPICRISPRAGRRRS